mgnify:FL=1
MITSRGYKEYLVILVVFLLLDAVFIGTTMPIFESLFKEVQGKFKVARLVPALLVYFLLTFALQTFVSPRIQGYRYKQIIKEALFYGGLFGATAFGTYDFTNLATLEKWKWSVSAMDITWGAFVCAASTGIARMIFTRDLRRRVA